MLGKGYLWAADENGGMYWEDVEKKDHRTLDTKGRSHGKWEPAEGLGVGSDSRACLGDSDIAHCVQKLEDELSVTAIFLVCPAVKGLTLSGTGTRQIVLDTKSFALLEYMGTQETNAVSALNFGDLDSHFCFLMLMTCPAEPQE